MAMIQHKVVFVGNSAVGKTSIINQYMYDSVSADHQPTVGIDFFAKTVNYEGKSIRMQIWDTAGQEKFHSLIPSYIRDSTVAIFVFDITSRSSFEDLEKWFKMVLDIANPRLIIVGNKCDLDAEREVTKDDAEKYAIIKSADYIETSAIAPTNITELFNLIASTPSESESTPQNTNQLALDTTPRQALPAPEPTPAAAPAPSVDLTKPANPQAGGGCSC
ncbi:Ras family protein [Trichomonas vaginalis G3]|uniref:Ras family protein n=2 Tax=Trichomonas vaginalis TaxID=5722 RepID=A0A8U0WP20_TRIV3|nr:small Rab GTPase Rab6b [Trichomonas vaginalis G3]AAZ73170.1 small Rab GTPase Rab6b [Trichomonas vaginalis]EAY22598.1 Ras family protein [Trichomonas vaginalis G3]KAI5497330.1 small Rab GTPase Rab6b [Trichomonas vaginalis G3]|eukprot:XP_001583584.1 Ras family protein [Trichomonas vaginalis G3]